MIYKFCVREGRVQSASEAATISIEDFLADRKHIKSCSIDCRKDETIHYGFERFGGAGYYYIEAESIYKGLEKMFYPRAIDS